MLSEPDPGYVGYPEHPALIAVIEINQLIDHAR